MDKKYKLSLFGVFFGKSIEEDFQVNMMSRYSKSAAFVVLVFGFLFALLLVNDYEAVSDYLQPWCSHPCEG